MGFFHEKTICFDIRENYIKYIYGSNDDPNIFVDNYGYVNLEDEYVSDGLINKTDGALKILKNIIVKNNIKTKIAKVNLWHSAMSVRIVKIPYMPIGDLPAFMDAEIKRLLPKSEKELAYDYKVLEEVEDREKKYFNIMVTAFPSFLKDRLIELLLKIDLKLVTLDVYPNTISRVYSYNKKEDIAIADVNGNHLDFVIVSNGKMFMYSNVLLDNFAGLGGKSKTEKINFLKDDRVLFEIMRPINSFMSSYLNYFITRRSGKKLDKIYLLGGISELENIDVHLTNRFGVIVERGLPPNIKSSPEVDMRHYVGALGLLLRNDI